MKTKTNTYAGLFLLLILSLQTYAQGIRSIDQSSSGRNFSDDPGIMKTGNWSFGLGTGTSFGLNSNEQSMFRGNSMTTKMFGRYYFGSVGLGVTTGITPGTISTDALNKFIIDRKFPKDQIKITKANPLNSYFLFGPSFSFGGKLNITGDLQGGMFVNNPGSISIDQQGISGTLYSFENGRKNIFPGFSGSLSINYPLSNTVHFFINADYLQSSSSVRVTDKQTGIDMPTEMKRSVNLMTAGVGILKTFGGKKKQPGGLITGNSGYERLSTNTTTTKQTQGQTFGERVIQRQTSSSCGPVTVTNVSPDGSSERITFSCPEDAVAYTRSLSTNSSAERKTKGKTFGESVASGLQAGAANNILFGTVTQMTGNAGGIETNKSISGQGGAVSSSYAAGRSGAAGSGGIDATFYARDADSKIALGRMAYQPIIISANKNDCKDCIATIVSNPAYSDTGVSGDNPMFEAEAKEKLMDNGDHDSNGGGLGDITVQLTDALSGALLATTKTEQSGAFFFANLPSGTYGVNISGNFISKKGYDIYLKKKAGLAGTLSKPQTNWIIEIGSMTGTVEQAVAVIKLKTKSNQSNDRVVNSNQDNSGITWSPRSNLKVLPASIGDLDDDGIPEMVIGNKMAGNETGFSDNGGTHLPPVRGAPVKGVGISLGKVPGGGVAARTITNENGEFEFTGVKAGNYNIVMQQTIVLNDETTVWVGESGSEDSNEAAARKGWDGSVKGNSKKEVQDFNTTRSNRERGQSLINSNGAKDSINNNGGGEEAARKGWDGTVKGYTENINTGQENLKGMMTSLNELDLQLNNDNSNSDAAINSARTGVKSLKAAIIDAQQKVDNLQQQEKNAALQDLERKMKAVSAQLTILQTALSSMGKQYSTISNVLKTKHDTVKNSINNLR
ncbi:MAG: hypothetical protein IT214_14115 [Chitinophagaceae bacterium]|nr:hypothetical protein [Chitinophagaceae bacterium]